MVNCTYCRKPLRRRYATNIFGTRAQCDRFWCQFRTGHLYWKWCRAGRVPDFAPYPWWVRWLFPRWTRRNIW